MKAFTFLKIITAINVIVATGFSVAGMINPAAMLPANVTTDKAATIFALYAGARTIPLAAIVIISIFSKSRNAFIALAFLAGVIQFLDGFVGLYQNDLSKTIGPFVIAIIEFLAIYLAVKKGEDGVNG